MALGNPWTATDPVAETLVRRLRTKVARQLADIRASENAAATPAWPRSDEIALAAKLINDELERHAHDLITRASRRPPPPTRTCCTRRWSTSFSVSAGYRTIWTATTWSMSTPPVPNPSGSI